MAGLGGLEGDLCRLGVAELADEDDVRVLAQHAAERLAEALGVEPDLALVHDAPLVAVEDLDRVFDRDDVLAALRVDVVEHRRERRRLPRARRAGDEYEAAVLLREPPDARRQVQLREVRDFVRDDAEHERDRAALAEAVHAEARKPRLGIRDVELADLVEDVCPRRGGGDRVEHRSEVCLDERRLLGERRELAVEPQHRRLPHLQVDVAGASSTARLSTAFRSMAPR